MSGLFSRPGHFNAGGRAPGTDWIGWLDIAAGLSAVQRKDLWEWNPIHQPSRPYASTYVELSEMYKASAEGLFGTKKQDVMWQQNILCREA